MDDSLERIAEEVSCCSLCRLSATRKYAVPGDGLCSAHLIIIGEAPGRKEDEIGKPFVGAAGEILNKALEKAGIERSNVFITNTVKCHPPNNRVPESDEQSTCRFYLERQISLIKPKIICILGGVAYQSILGGQSIMLNRGKFVNRNGQTYFLTIHPAATIYNRTLLKILETDLVKLANELNRQKIKEHLPKNITTENNRHSDCLNTNRDLPMHNK